MAAGEADVESADPDRDYSVPSEEDIALADAIVNNEAATPSAGDSLLIQKRYSIENELIETEETEDIELSGSESTPKA